jgi:hypothetical protein
MNGEEELGLVASMAYALIIYLILIYIQKR